MCAIEVWNFNKYVHIYICRIAVNMEENDTQITRKRKIDVIRVVKQFSLSHVVYLLRSADFSITFTRWSMK